MIRETQIVVGVNRRALLSPVLNGERTTIAVWLPPATTIVVWREGLDLNPNPLPQTLEFRLLLAAMKDGNTYAIKCILEANPEYAKVTDRRGCSMLMSAVGLNNIELVELFINYGANVNAKADNGVTALFYAIGRGHLDIVKTLVKHGACVNVTPPDQLPLMYAAWCGNLPITKFLIDHGAEVDARDMFGRTPLMEATQRRHFEVAQLLIDHGADLEARDNRGNYALNIARGIDSSF